MDSQDWALVKELAGNARVSYQALAKKFGLSPNTIKTRINRLREQRVLLRSGIVLSREMLGVEDIIAVISTDGTEVGVHLMEQMAAQPVTCEVYRTGDRRYELWALVSGTSEAFGLKRFLEKLDGVINVEMRPIVFFLPNMDPEYWMNTRGKKVAFTKEQLRVLDHLFWDARMSVSQIAQKTGITPKRVRKILHDLEEGGGVQFITAYDIFALGDMEYRLKIWFDPAHTTGQDLAREIAEKYPNEFWWSSITTNEPILDVGLIINDANQVHPIIREIRTNSHITAIEDFVTYPRHVRVKCPLTWAFRDIIDRSNL
ncbi:MAG: winged helix-turn-helix transcriptional regulator [Candidatus Hermodarchaeota archaeon]